MAFVTLFFRNLQQKIRIKLAPKRKVVSCCQIVPNKKHLMFTLTITSIDLKRHSQVCATVLFFNFFCYSDGLSLNLREILWVDSGKLFYKKKQKKKNYCWKIRSEIVNSKFLQEVVHLTKSIISSFSLEILIPQILLKLHPKTRDPEDLLQHQITNLLINITHENALDQEVSHSKTRLSIGKSKS